MGKSIMMLLHAGFVIILANACASSSSIQAQVLYQAVPAGTNMPDRAYSLLMKIPGQFLELIGGSLPDKNGLVGDNKGGYRSPAFQRGAARAMMNGILWNDRRIIDDSLRAFDEVFKRQDGPGRFGGDNTPNGVAFWLCEANQALLLMQESSLAADYAARVSSYIPKIHKAALWLGQREQTERLLREDASAPNRLIFDALACALSGLLCKDESLIQTGRMFLDRAMALYRAEDGVFLEKNGHDSSYQAVNAWLLQVWIIYFPEPTFEQAAARAVRWEIGRIKEDGSVDTAGNTRTGLGQEMWQGRVKDVNFAEVLRCILYFRVRTGDTEAIQAATRLSNWIRQKK
ncbi:MAG: hypothetical protein EHM28_00230 [Spirochaetaceae bacterium]|nr:MAG: hypothetical protein EHM28_00230 [Spirochaetaceae bacterium]